MLNPLKQNPRLFSGRSHDIFRCGRPKVCVKGKKVVLVYCFKMCTTLYLYSSGCIVEGNTLKAIRLWEMVRYGFQVYVSYANRSIWSICQLSYVSRGLNFDLLCIRNTNTARQLPNSNSSRPCSYHMLTKLVPGTKSFLLDNLNHRRTLYRSK